MLVIVALHSGPQFRLLPGVWCVRAYQSLPRAFRKHVKHVILLQPSMLVKAAVTLLYPFVSSKAHAKVKQVGAQHCSTEFSTPAQIAAQNADMVVTAFHMTSASHMVALVQGPLCQQCRSSLLDMPVACSTCPAGHERASGPIFSRLHDQMRCVQIVTAYSPRPALPAIVWLERLVLLGLFDMSCVLFSRVLTCLLFSLLLAGPAAVGH